MTENPTELRTCEQHGAYDATGYGKGRYWSTCPECEKAERRARQEEAQRLAQEERQAERVRESGIVGRYLDASLGNFKTTTTDQGAVLAACSDFVSNFKPDQGAGLLLIGPPGTGKSHLGSAIALEIIRRYSVCARVLTAREIVRALRKTWRRDSEESEDDVLGQFSWCALLVLDEVGGGFDSDSERAQLFEVLDLRYQLKRPTIVLSNLNLPQLREALGERSFDRIREGARTLVLNWASYRARSAA